MLPFVESLVRQVNPTTLLDIAITAFFIYWLFSLIRGTRAVTLVIGVSILLGVYALAQWLQLRLFTQLLQAGAVVGLFALVVVFQPELRRALERIGRVGTIGLAFAPAAQRRVEHVAAEVSKAAALLSHERHGALIVIERETGLEEIAETGVMLHSDLSHELLCTIFMPRTELHDGAVIIREDAVIAAAALLPLTEMDLSSRYGTRHRAALGVTEDTDAVAVVVSEETGQMSVVERARIVRIPSEGQLERALLGLLESPTVPGRLGRGGSGAFRRGGTLRIARRKPRPDGSTPATGTPAAATQEGSAGNTAPTSGPVDASAEATPAGAATPSAHGAGTPSTISATSPTVGAPVARDDDDGAAKVQAS